MTAHEVFTALVWIVLAGYLTYLGWFAMSTVGGWRRHQSDAPDPMRHLNEPNLNRARSDN